MCSTWAVARQINICVTFSIITYLQYYQPPSSQFSAGEWFIMYENNLSIIKI